MKVLVLTFFVILSLQAQSNPVVIGTVTIDMGSGLIAVCPPNAACTISVDNAIVLSRVAAPTAWPPGPWCHFSAQWAEDGNYQYGCHQLADGSLQAYRFAVQLQSGSTPPPSPTTTPGAAIQCNSKAIFSTSAAGAVPLVPSAVGLTTVICHIDWSGDKLAVVSILSGNDAVCSNGPSPETGVFTGLGGGTSSVVMDYASPLPITTGKFTCLSLSGPSTGGGTVIYAQR